MFGLCTVCAAATAREQREAAAPVIAAAYDAAPDEWKRKALAAIRELCAAGRPFSSDDVWLVIPTTREPRAMGGVFQEAKRLGLCAPTGDFHVSTHPAGHGRTVRVWAPVQATLPV